jgi:predicted dehydrogenase
MVGYQLRFHPVLRAAATALAEGSCGVPVSVRATVGESLPNFHRYEDYRRMYASRADLGGGVIVTQIHEFDWLYSLFGLPSRLFALGGHWSDLEIDVEDTASVLMECAVAGRPLPVHLHQDYLQDPPSRNCEIICEHGKITLDFAQTTTLVQERGGAANLMQFPEFQRNDLFLDQTRHFLDCVARRTKPTVDLADGIQSLRMALAAKASIASGRVVSLKEVPLDV